MAVPSEEERRLREEETRTKNWKRFGPYLAERSWATVREDYSHDGNVWESFTHEMARFRAFRWGEDGILGLTDREGRIAFALSFWNEKDPFIKERLFGLTEKEGNHGEDVKESYHYLVSTPTHSYMKALYQYPQSAFPYKELVEKNQSRNTAHPEFEIEETGVFKEGRYFDVFIEYAKNSPNDILIRVEIVNRSEGKAKLHLLPTLWFRNTWSWHEDSEKPLIKKVSDKEVTADHSSLKRFRFAFPEANALLFTENDTNLESLYGVENRSKYTKDAFNAYLVEKKKEAINPHFEGTKFAPHYLLHFEGHEKKVLEFRFFSEDEKIDEPFGDSFRAIFEKRKEESEDFFNRKIPLGLSQEEKEISKLAYSGLLWNKQFYHYVVEDWLKGDPLQPSPPPERKKGRNSDWPHFYASDVLVMPDKWEYPWFASWDHAFQMVAIAKVDPRLAKEQLLLFLREWYMHPSGALPAYEFSFFDANPPVHAWGAWRVYKMTGKKDARDKDFLEKVFQKLLLNFTWWVNRKDLRGKHLFSGGFLGLDNIGVINRTLLSQSGIMLEQADATAWMAFYCLTMLAIALELAERNAAYEDLASKFFEHFIHIADNINRLGGTGLWDEEDGFYYDHINEEGSSIPLRTKSLVGLIPLIAVEVLDQGYIENFPGFKKRMNWFLEHRSDLKKTVSFCNKIKGSEKLLLAIPSWERLSRILKLMLSESEFLSPFGIRSLSKYHEKNPYRLTFRGITQEIGYEPGESMGRLYGGNSNWRGPIWFPINFLLIEALERYYYFIGDHFQIEYPTGSGNMKNLKEVSRLLSERLISLFKRNPQGKIPSLGTNNITDYPFFYEYFHAETGQGLGASHQTGWTALVAKLLEDKYK